MDVQTRHEAAEIILDILPNIPPVCLDNFGYQGGGWYYALWRNAESDDKMVCRFNRARTDRKAYFVAYWDRNQYPTRQEVVDVVDRDAQGLRQVNMTHGVVIKRGYIPNKLHVWSTKDFEIVYDLSHEQHMIGSYLAAESRRAAVNIEEDSIWNQYKGFRVALSLKDGVPPERIAEKMAMDLAYAHVTSKLEGQQSLHIDLRHPHFYAAQANWAVQSIWRKYSKGRALTIGDFGWEAAGVFFSGGVSLSIGLAKSLFSMGLDVRHLLSASSRDNPTFNQPNLSNAFVRGIIGKSKYIDPLGKFFHPVDQEFLEQGEWVKARDFGNPGLAPVYRHTFDRPEDAELLLLIEPMIGSQIRLNRFKTIKSNRRVDNVYAVRILQPNGFVVTVTRATDRHDASAYVHYEPWRNFQQHKKPLFSQSFLNKLTDPDRFCVYGTSNLLLGHEDVVLDGAVRPNAGFKPVDCDELNDRFREISGSPYVRPVTDRTAVGSRTATLT
jgi:hypothetical protein